MALSCVAVLWDRGLGGWVCWLHDGFRILKEVLDVSVIHILGVSDIIRSNATIAPRGLNGCFNAGIECMLPIGSVDKFD